MVFLSIEFKFNEKGWVAVFSKNNTFRNFLKKYFTNVSKVDGKDIEYHVSKQKENSLDSEYVGIIKVLKVTVIKTSKTYELTGIRTFSFKVDLDLDSDNYYLGSYEYVIEAEYGSLEFINWNIGCHQDNLLIPKKVSNLSTLN